MKLCQLMILIFLAFECRGLVHPQSQQDDRDNRFSVKNSIEMTTFSDPFTRSSSATSKLSPNGRYFVVVTTKGHLRSNQIESSVWVFSSAQVEMYLEKNRQEAPPRPRLLFRTMGIPVAEQVNSYGSLVRNVQWSSNSRSVLALVEKSNGHRHIIQMSIRVPSRVTDLTPPASMDVKSFTESAGTIAYLADAHIPSRKSSSLGEPINARASVLTGVSLYHILSPEIYPERSSLNNPLALWINRKGNTWKIDGHGGSYFPTGASALGLALSPDGSRLVAAQPVTEIPRSWSRYRMVLKNFSFDSNAFLNADRSGVDRYWPWQYTIVNIDKRLSRPLVAAPSSYLSGEGDSFQAVWSKDGSRILFTGSYLPLSDLPFEGGADFSKPCAAAIYTVATGAASCIAFSRFPTKDEFLREVEFTDDPGHQVRLRWLMKGALHSEGYEEKGACWALQGAKIVPKQLQRVTLFIHQDLDVPPTLWATDKMIGASKQLWDPNPRLHEVRFGKAQVYRWQDSNGYTWNGGLIVPPDYVPGRRYPLVIQTHGFNDHEFLADGAFTSGFAAQPLAAVGMVVLQVEDRIDRHAQPATEEASLAVSGFEAAIEQLSAEGIVDPDRVGIIGFSRTQWYVENALIHCPRCYKAASVVDGVDQSYVTDILFSPEISIMAKDHEAANGGKPFGSGLKQWMKRAPGFNLDKVDAPIRIEAIGTISLLGEWELYSSLLQQGKPVDLIYIPKGQHILQEPLERYTSQQGNVDWFRFWLQGSMGRMMSQNERWEKMRDLQKVVVAHSPDE
jgi:hypothetical protein